MRVRDRYRVGVCERESKCVGESEWVSVRKRKIVFVPVFKSVCLRERERVCGREYLVDRFTRGAY